MAKKWKKPKITERGSVFRTWRLRKSHKKLLQSLSPFPPLPGVPTRFEVFQALVPIVQSLELPPRKSNRELIRLEFPAELLKALQDKSDTTAPKCEEDDIQPWPMTDILVVAAEQYAKQNGKTLPNDYVSPLSQFDEMTG